MQRDSQCNRHYGRGPGRPPSYLQKAIPLLEVDERYLIENISFEIRLNETLVGFFAFALRDDGVHLDHLWIERSKIKMGIGRQALLFADEYAKKNGWSELITYPDPPAEGFYLKSGFLDTGRKIPSRIQGGPNFSIFVKKFGVRDLNVLS